MQWLPDARAAPVAGLTTGPPRDTPYSMTGWLQHSPSRPSRRHSHPLGRFQSCAGSPSQNRNSIARPSCVPGVATQWLKVLEIPDDNKLFLMPKFQFSLVMLLHGHCWIGVPLTALPRASRQSWLDLLTRWTFVEEPDLTVHCWAVLPLHGSWMIATPWSADPLTGWRHLAFSTLTSLTIGSSPRAGDAAATAAAIVITAVHNSVTGG